MFSSDSLSVRELSGRARLSYSTAQREVDRLEKAGILRSRRFAQARVVRPDERHRLYPELRALLLKTYGPEAVLAELLKDEPGIEEAFLYGSWAARYGGEWGPPPADVDLLMIGRPDPRRIEEIAVEAEEQLGVPVEPVVVAPETWASRASGFVRTVRKRPLVRIGADDS